MLTQAIPGFLGLDLGTDVQPSSRSKLDRTAGLTFLEPILTRKLPSVFHKGLQDGIVRARRRIISFLAFWLYQRFRGFSFLGRGNNIRAEKLRTLGETGADLGDMYKMGQHCPVFGGLKQQPFIVIIIFDESAGDW